MPSGVYVWYLVTSLFRRSTTQAPSTFFGTIDWCAAAHMALDAGHKPEECVETTSSAEGGLVGHERRVGRRRGKTTRSYHISVIVGVVGVCVSPTHLLFFIACTIHVRTSLFRHLAEPMPPASTYCSLAPSGTNIADCTTSPWFPATKSPNLKPQNIHATKPETNVGHVVTHIRL